MSLCGHFRLLAPSELAQLQAAPETALDLLMPEDGLVPDECLLDLDRTWHALHFLLTGTADESPPPLGFILGGTPIGEDLGAGEARLHSPAEVARASQALEGIALEQLLERFDPDALGEHEVYSADFRGQSQEDIGSARSWVSDRFLALRVFLTHGARNGLGMVSAIL